jgi:hypothetical protein
VGEREKAERKIKRRKKKLGRERKMEQEKAR